jgi:hypothetical protein
MVRNINTIQHHCRELLVLSCQFIMECRYPSETIALQRSPKTAMTPRVAVLCRPRIAALRRQMVSQQHRLRIKVLLSQRASRQRHARIEVLRHQSQQRMRRCAPKCQPASLSGDCCAAQHPKQSSHTPAAYLLHRCHGRPRQSLLCICAFFMATVDSGSSQDAVILQWQPCCGPILAPVLSLSAP